jgi:hypothetical protein
MADQPTIDYTDKDFRSLRQAMLDLAAYRLPEWTDRSPGDIGVLLVDLFAYTGDIISYYQDRIAGESFLDTAVERRSVLNLLRMIGYELAPPVPAAAELTLTFKPPAAGAPTVVTIPRGAQFATKPPPAGDAANPAPAQIFEYLGPDLDVDLAGPRVVARPDGKLTFSGLIVRQSRSIPPEVLGSSTGEPNQRFRLAAAPLIRDSIVVDVDEGAGPVRWTHRENLLFSRDPDGRVTLSNPDSRDYHVEYDEDGASFIVFGDGVYGRRPPPGRNNIRATYAIGGGAAGNVAGGAIVEPKTRIVGLDGVTNPKPAAGGTEAEPTERAVRFGPLAFRSGDRAVTLSDYVALAFQAGGVSKVRARTTGWNRVELYVAPEGEACVPAPDDLKQRLVAYFEDRRMVGTSVRIEDPVCVPIDIAVEVVPEHHYDPESVRQRAERAVAGLVAFRNVDFGRPMYLSKVYEAVEAIDGVLAATVVRFRRQDQVVPRTLRKKVLIDAGLADVSDFVERAFHGEIPIAGRIDIGEFELPTPGAVTVTLRYDR